MSKHFRGTQLLSQREVARIERQRKLEAQRKAAHNAELVKLVRKYDRRAGRVA